MRRKAHTLSGQGASSSTVVSESALVSENRTRTPSQTLKYVVIGEPGPALIWSSSSCPDRLVEPVSFNRGEAASHEPAISKLRSRRQRSQPACHGCSGRGAAPEIAASRNREFPEAAIEVGCSPGWQIR